MDAAFALGLADLAAIGSVADVVPIDGENRAILRLGLAALAARQLVRGSRHCSPRRVVPPERVTPSDRLLAIAPRINAIGRIGQALDGGTPVADGGPGRDRAPRGASSRQPTPSDAT